ncbi:MAG: DNA repair protein RecN [Verrucomicrobiales bacterium]|jgi:DNA repair protein RecN (Recombination protein N)|nr:DNA repair protein RecN [Verrucomicrobiales bacterium]
MLRSLRIKNLALIDDLTWELGEGLNILTGETGAGKSILIDAFNLLLGERAEKSLVRDGAEECVVEGSIANAGFLNPLLEENGLELCQDGELFLKRSFGVSKGGKQFINGSPAPLQVLKKIGDVLADMHGPHDHQSLLSNASQLRALDAYSGLEPRRDEVAALFHAWQRLRAEMDELNNTPVGDLQQQLDFLDRQIEEISDAKLNEAEEEQLERDYRVGSNSRRILEIAGAIETLLSDGEGDVLSLLASVQKQFAEWQHLDPDISPLAEQNTAVVTQLQELARDIRERAEATELDAERLQQIEERINLVQGLKRKYGSTVNAILERLAELQGKRAGLANREERARELKKLIADAEQSLMVKSEALSKDRKKAAPALAKEISRQLKDLGFKQADLSIQLERHITVSVDGLDKAEFCFAPNPGESAKPLKAIASSGEMARVMLAIKSVLAEEDSIPILIFDEVDANVGGETALAVGKRLRALAKGHQVLCITHLPQVAAAGQQHFSVQKNIAKGRTVTQLDTLTGKARVQELARMLGDKGSTAQSLAESLLKQFDGSGK